MSKPSCLDLKAEEPPPDRASELLANDSGVYSAV